MTITEVKIVRLRILTGLVQAAWMAGFVVVAVSTAAAQTAPAPLKSRVNLGAYNYLGQVGVVCGGGASYSVPAKKPTVQCGGLFTIFPFVHLEAGVMGPQAKASAVSGYFSTNLWVPLRYPDRWGGMRLLVGGYTRMFETGHALDYGLAYAHAVDKSHSIQLEVRDYWVFSEPRQHNVVFRVVWLTGLSD